jgi:hypothetical protein
LLQKTLHKNTSQHPVPNVFDLDGYPNEYSSADIRQCKHTFIVDVSRRRKFVQNERVTVWRHLATLTKGTGLKSVPLPRRRRFRSLATKRRTMLQVQPTGAPKHIRK